MQPLRDYQAQAVTEACDALKDARSVLFVCPTGGGKTFVFSELARIYRKNGRVLVLADREHLVEQAASVIKARTGLAVGIEQGTKHVNRRRMPDVVCATIQSMRQPSRLARFKPSDFALIVIDEADLGVAPSYGTVLARFPDARVFGCTATPDRADGKSLGLVFEKTVTPLYLGDLITRGFLAPMRRTLVRIESVTLADLSTSDGDYTATDLERVLTHEKALHEVARPSIELAGARPSIVFAATVKHAEALADVFNRYAPKSAAVIHGKMTVAERRRILSAYERGKIRFLCSCALLLRGIDLPLTSCVVMARPTQSRALYCQAIGRGTRFAPGKADLLVLDFTDNSENHSLISPVDILRPIADDVRERAREIADSQADADPQQIIEQAERELEADPELRERIRATVAFSARIVDQFDWTSLPLGKQSDHSIALDLGINTAIVRGRRRRLGIPAFVPEERRTPVRDHAIHAMMTADHHAEIQAAAEYCGISLSEWASSRLLEMARYQKRYPDQPLPTVTVRQAARGNVKDTAMARAKASEFLRRYLKDGPRSARDAYESGLSQNLAQRTVQRAARELGIPRGRKWALPETAP